MTQHMHTANRRGRAQSVAQIAQLSTPVLYRMSPVWWLVVVALTGLLLWQSARPALAESRVFVPMIPAVQTDPGGTGEEPTACGLSAEEQVVADAVVNDPGQRRTAPVCNATLAQVARARARDMAQRAYFAHVNPDGEGPNYLVVRAGYVLPDWYSDGKDANNIESIAGGQTTPEAAWNAWLNSSAHRMHVLGEHSFYAEQNAFGVGHYYDPNSPLKHYWVFLSAPVEE